MYGRKMMGKGADDGVVRKEETWKAIKEVYGRGERGHC